MNVELLTAKQFQLASLLFAALTLKIKIRCPN